MSYAHLKVIPSTRAQKREMLAEAKSLQTKVYTLIDEFENEVLTSPEHVEYETIFEKYRNKYLEEVNKIKPKYFELDRGYFTRIYKKEGA